MNDDAALVVASQTGDVSAFGELIERYHNLVCAIAYARTGDRAASEDVAQETFLAAWRGIGELREVDKLRGWLCTIARNLGAKSTRGTQRIESLDAHAGELAGDGGPLDAIIDKETEATVWAALERLPETYREPLVLFYREQQSITEVARGLGLSEETAKQRLSRGRQQLRDQMTDVVERTLASGRPRKAAAAAVLALIIASSKTPAMAATIATRRTGTWKLAGGAVATLAVAGAVVVATRESSTEKQATASGDLVTELRAARAAAPPAGSASTCELRGVLTGSKGPLLGGFVAVVEPTFQATALDPLVVETGADGRWRALVKRGSYTLAASAPGHTARAQQVTCSGAASEIDLAMTAGGPLLRGTVTDTGGGAIATANIWLADPQRPAQLFVTRTRADGTFELTAPRGLYMAIVAHPDYTLDARPITLGDAGAREALTLVPGASIEGVVTDETGAPLAGARVTPVPPAAPSGQLPPRWQTSAAYASLLPVISDASGHFIVRGLPPGTARLVARASRSASASPVEVTLTMAENKSGVTLATTDAHTLAGFVVAAGSRAGEPGVRVFAARELGGVMLPAMTTTDATGHFELSGLVAGSYRIFATGSDHAPYVGPSSIALGDRDVVDTLVTLPRGVEVRGRAAAGAVVSLRPAPGVKSPVAQVQAAMTRAEVDDHGAFVLAAVAPGDYTIAVTTFDEHGEAPLHVGTEAVTATVALAPRPVITGEVVDERGARVTGVLVSATPNRATGLFGQTHTTVRTDERGQYRIAGVLPGRHRLRVFDATGQRAFAGERAYDGLRVRAPVSGAVTERLVIARNDRRLTGVVVDGSGAPVAHAWVEVRPRDAHRSPELFSATPIVTDERGAFTIEHVAPDALVVEAANGNGTLRAAAVAEGRASLRLVLLPIALLTANVKEAGSVLAAFEVRITQRATGESRWLRATNGALTVPVHAGEHDLVVTSPRGYVKQTLTVTTPAPSVTLTTVAWSRVHGRITGATGEPWANATVHVHDALEPTLVRTGADGSFTLERMAAGPAEITFVHDTDIMGMTTLEVELTPGQTLDVGTIAGGAMRQGLSGASADLGLRFDVLDGGLVIVDVTPGGHGARAGLRTGDRVTRVGMVDIDSEIAATTMMRSLSTAWRSRGRAVPWTVTRGGTPVTLDVVVPNESGQRAVSQPAP